MTDVQKKLRQARPPLSFIAPLTHKIVWGFVILNLWIAMAIYMNNHLKIVIVNSIFNNIFWGTVFAILSVGIYIGLKRNDWKIIRWAMAMALLVKSMWTYAIIVLGFQTGFKDIAVILGLWLFALYIQAVAIVYFIPGSGNGLARE